MTNYIEDDTHHNCETIYGKAHHVCTDQHNKFYCGYCRRELTINQLADKWKRLKNNLDNNKELNFRRKSQW